LGRLQAFSELGKAVEILSEDVIQGLDADVACFHLNEKRK
jgi:hypothetical protein